MTYVIDTHPLVWNLSSDDRLSPAARKALDDRSAKLVIPAMVLAEISYLYAKRRIGVTVSSVIEHVLGTENTVFHPLNESLAEHLPASLDIHDGIIVATAIMFRDVYGDSAAVITKDRMITKSGLVDVLW